MRSAICLMVTEAFALHAPWMREQFGDYGELFRDRVGAGGDGEWAEDIVQAARRRRVLCQEMAAAMADLDIIVSAVAAGRGAAHRQRAQMGQHGEAVLHHAVQRHGLSRRSASAPASARAACRSRCSSPASRSPSRHCCAPPMPTRRRCRGAPSVRRWRCDLPDRRLQRLAGQQRQKRLCRRAEIAVAAVDGGDRD